MSGMKNVVYIFGAGASKDFELPLGNEIFQKADELCKYEQENESRLGLKSLLKNVEDNIHDIFFNLSNDKKEWPPFEEIVTFLWDLKKTEKYNIDQRKIISSLKTNAEDVFNRLVNFYASTMTASLYESNQKTNLDLFHSYIKSLNFRKDNISFISFNYDTLLDEALIECVNENIIKAYTYCIPLYDVIEKCEYGNANSPSRKSLPFDGIALIKPHGSLNLSYCGHNQNYYGEGFYYDKEYSKNIKTELKCPCCSNKIKRLLIPPLYNKSDFIESTGANKNSSTFKWRCSPENFRKYIDPKIKESLINADEIIIIGYSMPAYDIDFKSLLLQSLIENKKRKRVHLKIITKSPEWIIPDQFKHLVGKVTLEENEGFLNYLKKVIQNNQL